MYHSLIITTLQDYDVFGYVGEDITYNTAINTWDDWHLIPSTRPLVNPPTVKTQTIDVPGANGQIDLTENLLGYPLYNNRTGSWEFIVDNGHEEWYDLYSKIMASIHGHERIIILEDDPMWYYKGRLKVNSWKSEQHNSKITIDYDLYPYKRSRAYSDSEWKWDPFNLQTGVITQNLFGGQQLIGYKEIECDGKTMIFGTEPVVPSITLTQAEGATTNLRFTNNELHIDKRYTLSESDRHTYKFNDIVLTNNNGVNKCKFIFEGTGYLSIRFRLGRL